MTRTALRPKDWLHDRLSKDALAPDVYDRRWEPRLARKPLLEFPISQACTADQIYQVRYHQWVEEINQPYVIHRKQWEWVYILQSLAMNGCLREGKSGVGFGVGTEPITAVAAKRGARVLATDWSFEDADESGWVDTNQHAKNLESLNEANICHPEHFADRVSFRTVDMRDVPKDIKGYDFTWSACAFEHLGSLDAGFDFVKASIDCLKPGGYAVHTTEYNVSSNADTATSGHTVLYRRRDLERLAAELRSKGHKIDLTFGLGTTEDDRHIDQEPFTNTHLKVRHQGHVITSFGLTIRKAL